jgi:hypothetical protein
MRFQKKIGRAGLSIVKGEGNWLPLGLVKVETDTDKGGRSKIENGNGEDLAE